jgi:hypothetical protein
MASSGTGLPGGCTKDIVHRFYNEQYQLNGGQQNCHVTGSDAVIRRWAITTSSSRRSKYLHSRGAPKYVIADSFYQAPSAARSSITSSWCSQELPFNRRCQWNAGRPAAHIPAGRSRMPS